MDKQYQFEQFIGKFNNYTDGDADEVVLKTIFDSLCAEHDIIATITTKEIESLEKHNKALVRWVKEALRCQNNGVGEKGVCVQCRESANELLTVNSERG